MPWSSSVSEPPRILVVKTSAMGDIIHCFPVLTYIRERFPEATIDWVVERECAALLQSHPLVDTVHVSDFKSWRSKLFRRKTWLQFSTFFRALRHERYDIVFDLQGNCKSAFVSFLVRSKRKVGFGWAAVSEWPNLLVSRQRYTPPSGKNIREDYLFVVQSFFGDDKVGVGEQGVGEQGVGEQGVGEQGVRLQITDSHAEVIESVLQNVNAGERVIAVCPGSRWPNKRVGTDTLQGYLQALNTEQCCHFLLIWGDDSERLTCQELLATFSKNAEIINKMPLPALQNLLARVDLVIAMDSLPLHLAAAAGTPTFSVFGASSQTKYQPCGPEHQGIQGACPYGQKFEKRCPQLRSCATGACIKELDTQQLLDATPPQR